MKNDQKAMLYRGIQGMHVSPVTEMVIGDNRLDFSWKEGFHFRDEISGKKNLFKEDTEKFRERFGEEKNSADFDSKVYWEAILRKYNNDVDIDTRASSSTQPTTATPTTHPAHPHPTPHTPPPPPPPSTPSASPASPASTTTTVSSPASAPPATTTVATASAPPLAPPPDLTTTTAIAPSTTSSIATPSDTTATVIPPSAPAAPPPPPVFIPPVELPTPPSTSSSSSSTSQGSSNSTDTSQPPSLGGPYEGPSSPTFYTAPTTPTLDTTPYGTPPTDSSKFVWLDQPPAPTTHEQSPKMNLDDFKPNSSKTTNPEGIKSQEYYPTITLPPLQESLQQTPIEPSSTPTVPAIDTRSDSINLSTNKPSPQAQNDTKSLGSPESTTPLNQPEIPKDNQLKEDPTESRTIDPEIQEQIDSLTKQIKDIEEQMVNPLLQENLYDKLEELRKRLELIQK
jgi:hypothetical protein